MNKLLVLAVLQGSLLAACTTVSKNYPIINGQEETLFKNSVFLNTEVNDVSYEIIPAVTKIEKRQVIQQPNSVIERTIPTVTQTVSRRILKTPAQTVERIIPAITKQQTRVVDGEIRTETVVVKEATTELVTIPATYETVTETIVTQSESTEYVTVPAVYKEIEVPVEIRPEFINVRFDNPSSFSKVQPITESINATNIDSGEKIKINVSTEPFSWDLIEKGLGTAPPEFISPDGEASFFIDTTFFGEGAISLKRVYRKITEIIESENDPEYKASFLKYPKGFVILTSGEKIDESGKTIKKDGKRVKLQSKRSWIKQLFDSFFSSKDYRVRYISFTVRPSVPKLSGENIDNANILNSRQKKGFKTSEIKSLDEYLDAFYLRNEDDYVVEVNVHEFIRELPTSPNELEKFNLEKFIVSDNPLTADQHESGSQTLRTILGK